MLINLVATDSAGTLGLPDAEFDQGSANMVKIGDANSGPITICPIACLTLNIQKGVTFSTTGGFAFDLPPPQSLKTECQRINTSATLTATAIGCFVPEVADEFIVLNNLSAGTTTGNFSGLAEGTTVVIGTLSKAITYIGGTANDLEY